MRVELTFYHSALIPLLFFLTASSEVLRLHSKWFSLCIKYSLIAVGLNVGK